MFEVVLVNPQIPANTGNVMRMCANTGSRLHLVRPLGFELDDARLKRAGLDYRDLTTMTVHDDWDSLSKVLAGCQIWAFTRGAKRDFGQVSFSVGDVLVFGCETSGLPKELVGQFEPDDLLRIPMVEGSRSLNLSNAAAVAVYEAWRQVGYPGEVQA